MSLKKLLRKIIKKWKRECGVRGIIHYSYDQAYCRGLLTIYTSKPEKLEALLEKYTEILKTQIYDFKEVQFVYAQCIF